MTTQNKAVTEADKNVLWTIGHSTRTLEEFIALLQSFQIEYLVDIRSLPGSRKFPHFDTENLAKSLPQEGIHYLLLKKLGGRRKVSKTSKNTAWRHPAFRGYADYMETKDFLDGIKELKAIATAHRAAIMCAEAVWWRCHRSMVSDYLKSKGWTVWHIMGLEKSKTHPYTGAATIVDGVLHYDIPVDGKK